MSGQDVLHVARDEYLDTVKRLVDDGYTMCIDLTGVDYLELPGRSLPDGIVAERFEVVVNLLDMRERRRIRLRVQVPEIRCRRADTVRRVPGHGGNGA